MQPWLGSAEVAAVREVLDSGWVAQGPRVAEFERRFATAQGVGHAVATSSCTSALHLALVVAGVGPGDDVLVPSFSFIATANAPTYVGARPVFVDVEPMTGTMTPDAVWAALTPRTTAVIAVDQAGVPADIEGIRSVCDDHGVVVIEDAACAVGSTLRGRPTGGAAELAAWSFHPRKLLTTGEGGMLTTSRPEWAERAARLREHAMSVSAAERHTSVLAPAESYGEVGFNYRMTDLQAAVGIAQLDRLPAMVRRRRELAAVYHQALDRVAGLRAVTDPPWGTTNYQSFWIEVLPDYPVDRDGLLCRLAERGISARRGIMAAHRQPAHRGRHGARRDRDDLPVTDRLTDRTVVLPLFHLLTESDQARVVEVLQHEGAWS
jgi:dTDP-4-amino-4,6-dideoxygalactose transaminase